ncbi:SpoIIE family protein phosphatase [Kineococcus sp. SYSU DK006]|uniref:SpoIIE family protein phosphatase n=1 Tax=Kineococcus sp. SYSU DK006 TaxID=3383127 RepID=UPI003D7DCE54
MDAGADEGLDAAVDHAAVFAALPTPLLLLDARLRIVAVNDAYARATGRPRGQLLGRHVLEAFPDNPETPEARATANLGDSLRRVLRTGEADTMPLQRYDVPDGRGGFTEHWWSPFNAPVLDGDGRVRLVVHRVEDVTPFVHARGGDAALDAALGVGELSRELRAEADLHVRGHELRGALTAQAETAARLAGLVAVSVQLAAARTTAELADTVVHRGLAVLGADGGAVAVRSGEELRLSLTESLGPQAAAAWSRVPVDHAMPVALAAATGRRIVLPDLEAVLAAAPGMDEVVAATGMQAWICLPLRAGGATLGSLAVGWREPQRFAERDLELVDAFAAQCAQTLAGLQAAEAERGMSEALQRSLLTAPVQPEGMRVAVRYLPAGQGARVGGDWYDGFSSPDGATVLAIGDVAGHDREAAAQMGQLRNLLRGVCAALGATPAQVLAGLDRAMHQLHVPSVATAVLAHVEPPEGEGEEGGVRRLRWSNAGHLPPVLVAPGADARLLDTPPDLLLGLQPEAPRHDHTASLPPGSTLVFFTDGLVERRGEDLHVGLERLRRRVADLRDRSAEEVCDALVADLGDTREDDVAILVLHVAGPAGR